MAAVAGALARVEAAVVERDGIAVPLPFREAAGEGDDIRVAELGEGAGRERGAAAPGAVGDDRPVPVRDDLLDPRLEVPARDEHRSRQVPLVPLVALAHVEEERRLVVGQELVRATGVDLVDLRLRLREELTVGRHFFPKCSEAPRAAKEAACRRAAGIVGAVSARARVYATVAALALAAAAAVIGVTLVTRTTPSAPAAAKAEPPPLLLDLGVRTDPEARALRRAAQLYDGGRRPAAARIFRRYDSVAARVGAVLAEWPRKTVPRLRALARAHPRGALAQLHYGVALLVAGRRTAAQPVLRRASRVQPDTFSAIRAGNLLHTAMPPNLPPFEPSFGLPPRVQRLAPPAQLRALARAARRPDPRAKLLYGVALQTLGRPLSAERQFA